MMLANPQNCPSMYAGAPLPKFKKLANEGAPAFLQGLFVADKVSEDNATSLSTLVRSMG